MAARFRKKPVEVEAVQFDDYPCRNDIFRSTYDPAWD